MERLQAEVSRRKVLSMHSVVSLETDLLEENPDWQAMLFPPASMHM